MSSLPGDITVPGRPEVHEVSAGVYAYVQPDGTWWINNTGFVVGPQGVISIDACSTERRTRAYLAAIGAVTRRPGPHPGQHPPSRRPHVRQRLFPTATIVAHESARAEAIAFGPAAEPAVLGEPGLGRARRSTRRSLPSPTRSRCTPGTPGSLCVHVGTAAHTTNDSIVWLPERSVLFCGDLVFNGGTPFLLMGSVAGAVEVLEQVVRAARRPDRRARARSRCSRATADRSTRRWTTCGSCSRWPTAAGRPG